MPDTPETAKTPTHRRLVVVGRPGAGADGAHGGICFYDGGEEFRCQPGDVVDVPAKVAFGFLADGLATLAKEA